MGPSFVGYSARLTPMYVFVIVKKKIVELISCRMLKEALSHPGVKYIECDQVFTISSDKLKDARAIVTQTGATWVCFFIL